MGGQATDRNHSSIASGSDTASVTTFVSGFLLESEHYSQFVSPLTTGKVPVLTYPNTCHFHTSLYIKGSVSRLFSLPQ